jgi:hypothetical protein
MKNQKRLAATAFMFALNQAVAQNVVMQQPITPDMCVDAVCVEQDLGVIPAGLAWTAPARPEEPTRDFKKSYDEGVRKGLDTCEQSNKAQWGSKASKLCDLLIFGNQRPRAELVSFFAENKQPVCVTGGKFFNFGLTTPLGATKFQVKFGRDGRPRVAEITKFFAVSKDEQAALKAQIEKKHPYLHGMVRRQRLLGVDTSGSSTSQEAMNCVDVRHCSHDQTPNLTKAHVPQHPARFPFNKRQTHETPIFRCSGSCCKPCYSRSSKRLGWRSGRSN